MVRFFRRRQNPRNVRLNTLVDLYYKVTYHAALSVAHEPELAQEATHNAFLKAFEKLDQLKDVDKARAWLARIAIREVYNLFRSKFRTREVPTDFDAQDQWIDETSSSLESDAITRMELERLAACVRLLSEEEQLLYHLKYVEELPNPLIARAICVPVGTVKSRLFRLRKKTERLDGTRPE